MKSKDFDLFSFLTSVTSYKVENPDKPEVIICANLTVGDSTVVLCCVVKLTKKEAALVDTEYIHLFRTLKYEINQVKCFKMHIN